MAFTCSINIFIPSPLFFHFQDHPVRKYAHTMGTVAVKSLALRKEYVPCWTVSAVKSWSVHPSFTRDGHCRLPSAGNTVEGEMSTHFVMVLSRDLNCNKVQILRAEEQKLEQIFGSVESISLMHMISVELANPEKLVQSFIFAEHSRKLNWNCALPLPEATFSK